MTTKKEITESQILFLKLHLFEDKNYANISEILDISIEKIREWWDELEPERKVINKSKQMFNSRKGKDDFSMFEKLGSYDFYQWYKKQSGRCYYCKSEEYKLEALFHKEKGILSTKRNRGRSLELERLDAKGNLYTPDNCVLACYFCNNHKSDIISEEDFMKFFSVPIREYIDAKYKELITDDNRS